ncbi:hypothetical protein IWQ62_000858 [Dispira parvispora]|uniref:Chitin-binding type-4 domain-containing protein n=1 Tax=Dispira parvispora TaxID=1520584 RepID=A0A9W8AW92_9FUNG|nr:hypothetical protein IWQ62_000858 [Dispira parvispora]
MKLTFGVSALAVLLASPMVLAHEHIAKPCIRRSPIQPECEGFGEPDYNAATPISTKDTVNRDPMCRGPRGKSNGVLKAGETITLEFINNAIHKGGHCEVAMSTNEKDWAVILTKLTSCFVDEEGLNIKATIPKDAPSLEHVVISWTWVNAEGNREFYMNCMDFSLEGVEGGKIEGPQMVIANHPGYPTIGQFAWGEDPRLDLYQNRPNIIINGDGSVSGGNSTTPQPSASNTSASDTTPTDTPTESSAGTPTNVPTTSVTSPGESTTATDNGTASTNTDSASISTETSESTNGAPSSTDGTPAPTNPPKCKPKQK